MDVVNAEMLCERALKGINGMIFHRRRVVTIQIVIYIIFLSVVYFSFNASFKESFFFIILFILITIYTLGNYWVIKNKVLYKYIFFRETEKIFLEDIN
jgi:hypothetical protein